MRETSIRWPFLALLVLFLSAVSSFAQSGGDRDQMSPPLGRYRPAPLSVGALSIFFSGNFSYNFGGGVAVMKADNVTNTNATATGPLRFSLWFTTSPYPASGYSTASYDITSSLAAGASIAPVNGGGTSVPFTLPPTGCYRIALVLEELVSSTWTMRDYGNFSLSIDVGGGCITSFAGSPATIASGASSTLSWTTTGSVNGVSIDNGVGGQPANGSKSVTPAATTTYTLVASGTANGNIVSKQTTVTVGAPAPTATFSASPTSIVSGNSSTLTWSTTNATSASLDHGIGTVAVNGSTIVSPTSTTTYTLTVNGSGGTITKTATVTVSAPAPTATFSASPPSIPSGASSTLTWSTTDATSVSLDNGIGAVSLNGSKIVSPASTTTYTLTVAGSGGTITKNATVTVTALPPGLSVTASGSPLTGTAPFTTSFSATGHGGTPPYSFKWSTGETTAAMSHQWKTPGTLTVSVTVTDGTAATAVSNTLPVTVNAPTTGPCSDPQYVCLSGGRFAVKIDWKTTDGKSSGVAAPIKYTPDSGLFWFFGPDNIEVLLKVLNACALNSKYWIFSAATTDVEYTITVLDTVSGNQKTYFHAGGTPAPAITDTDGLPCTGGLTSEEPMSTVGATSTLAVFDGPSLPNATSLCLDPNYVCLSGSRFAVKIDWKTTDGKTSGAGVPIKYTPDSGLFWFFGPDNIEVLLKVLNGCALNNKYWVFSAATTDVEYTITVTDTLTGKVKTYFHAGGTPAPAITDTDAMQCSQ